MEARDILKPSKNLVAVGALHLIAAHYRACNVGHGKALAAMLTGWAFYAEEHEKRFGSKIGDDGFLGPVWERQGSSILDLLNGETGGFDGGSIDGNIRNFATFHGCDGGSL